MRNVWQFSIAMVVDILSVIPHIPRKVYHVETLFNETFALADCDQETTAFGLSLGELEIPDLQSHVLIFNGFETKCTERRYHLSWNQKSLDIGCDQNVSKFMHI